jgi:RHS repeat-associated protein
LNQLKRENNVATGKTVVYEYDLGGNILNKKIYGYTTISDVSELIPEIVKEYQYSDNNWKDKLTSYDGQSFIYDAIGNPLQYRDGMKFEWICGRRLDKASKTGYDVSYKYDDGGTRTQKNVNGVTTDFVTNGIQVLAQKIGNETIVWNIDANGTVVGFNHICPNLEPNFQDETRTDVYFYLKNAQGDIVGIVGKVETSPNQFEYQVVANYTYDSWGKLISVKDKSGVDITDLEHIAHKNPLRYRGYYYDLETELYYLNARYYDPEIGRFIGADGNFAGGLNFFAYCGNNPVNFFDLDGTVSISVIVGGVGAFGTVAAIAAVTYKVMSSFTWDSENKIYYAGIDMWQREFGYDSVYDWAIPWIEKKRINFRDENDKDWIIWMWKGYYGPLLGTGAEVGLYTPESFGKFPVPFKIDNRCANNDEMLEMSYTLKNKKGETLFSRGPENHWWLVGFKPSTGFYWSSNLTLDCIIAFPTEVTAINFELAAGKVKGISSINRVGLSVGYTF